MCAREKGNLLSAGKRGVRFLMFLCRVQTSTVQSGEWRRSELQYRQRRDDEPLVEPVTALMKLWFSCTKRLNVGVFSSFQFTTKQKYPAVLDKQKHPAVLVQPKLGGEGLFLSFNDLSFFLFTHCSGAQTPDQHWLRKMASYIPTCHLLFSVPLLAVFRQILDKEKGGEWMLVHLTAEVSRIQCSWFQDVLHIFLNMCSKNPVNVEGKGKEKAESSHTEKQSLIEMSQKTSGLIPLWSGCIWVQSSAEKAQGLLQSQAKWVVAPTEGNKMSTALLSVWLGQELRREGEKREEEQEIQLSGVSWLCSSSCSSPWLQSFGSGSKTCFAWARWSPYCSKETSARMLLPAPVHITRWEHMEGCTTAPYFPWGDQEKDPHFTCSPQGILQPPGFYPFLAERLSYLLILFQQGHLTRSGRDAALLSLTHQSTNSPLIIPHYTRVTMRGPEHGNEGNRVLMQEYIKYSLPTLSEIHHFPLTQPTWRSCRERIFFTG